MKASYTSVLNKYNIDNFKDKEEWSPSVERLRKNLEKFKKNRMFKNSDSENSKN